MVKITYTGSKFTRRKLPSGRWISWRPNKTIDVESKRLVKELEGNRDFVLTNDSTSKVGGGLKTGVRTPQRRGRPPKAKQVHVNKEKSLKSKVQDKVDKVLKKPKGLRKSKRAD